VVKVAASSSHLKKTVAMVTTVVVVLILGVSIIVIIMIGLIEAVTTNATTAVKAVEAIMVAVIIKKVCFYHQTYFFRVLTFYFITDQMIFIYPLIFSLDFHRTFFPASG